MKNILVTGGLGFIGSHTIIELSKYDYNIIVVDNLSNSNINMVEKINGLIFPKEITFFECDIINTVLLDDIFKWYNIYGVIHFAALKSVSESVQYPLMYYNNNIVGTINFINHINI